MEFFAIAAGAVVILLFTTFLILASRYKRCPSDAILVIYGKIGESESARCIHGGGALVWPLVQDYAFLSLTPLTINIPLKNALSMQNIRIHVPSTFTVGVSTAQEIMQNAAERLLGLKGPQIEEMAREIIFGQLRLTVASLTIEEINQDRERFLESIRKNVEPELNKIGLNLINVNITDITDESDYIESIGQKAASTAINQALIDVAEQEKHGSIGRAEAHREQTIRVAVSQAESDKGEKSAEADRRIFVHGQEAAAVTGENKAKADIAEANAELAIRTAAARQRGEVAESQAVAEIQRAHYLAEQERLNAEQVVQKEIDKRKIEITAEAEAEKTRREARGQADAILARYEAEAKGVKQVLDAKAEGYKGLLASCGGDAKAAATLLMVEKIEAVVAKQVEAISNLKIDKITVWDSGSGEGGSSTSNFVSSLVRSLPPLQDVASMAGVELPGFLGSMAEDDTSAPAPTEPTKRETRE